MATFVTTPESLAELHFPLAGVNVSIPFERSPAVQLPGGEYAKFTPTAVNVRGYGAPDNRLRGAVRPGLARYGPAAPIAWLVQDLNLVSGTGYPPPGGNVQTSQSGRVVTLVSVQKGQVYAAQAGDTAWTAAVNATGRASPLNVTGQIFSSANNQKLYFADGRNYAVYNPATNTVSNWTTTPSTGGTLPRDTDGNAPRLICTWRGRTVLSGLLLDSQNWFMSHVSDPNDFNYAPEDVSPAQAVAGNASSLGFVGDVVTALIPYSDDLLIIGGDHSLWAISGDPMSGGQIDLISDVTGTAWGQSWCKSPDGTVYFLSNRTGVYALQPGQGPPVRISQQVEQLLLDLDTGVNIFRMVWNDRFQGFHLFATPGTGPSGTTHFFWEARSRAWWTDTFADTAMNPTACCIFDGNLPTDRTVLVGSWDGVVRRFDSTTGNDDGEVIASRVVLGPILTSNMDEVLLKDVQAILAQGNGAAVSYAIRVGASAESALTADPVATGTWNSGRNLTNLVRRSGHAVWVELSSTGRWAMEAIRLRVAAQGKVRRRGY